MTHEPETEFHDAVTHYFQNQPEVERVESQVYQPGPYWFVDLVVEYPWTTLFVEIENDWASVRNGIGQAVGYAGTPMNLSEIPIVVFPAEHVKQPDLDRLRGGYVLVQPFDSDNGVFVDG